MTKKILVLPGDGVGPSVVSSAVEILETAARNKTEIIYGDVGQSAFVKTSEYLPSETLDLATEVDAILAGGTIEMPADRTYNNPIRTLKKQLNLYSVVRKFYPLSKNLGVRGVDLLVVTGNTDTLLKSIETETLDGVDYHKFLSAASCKKLFQNTLRLAILRDRKKITCAHRTSAFPALDGLFVECFYKEFAGSSFLLEEMEVDEVAAELTKNPSSMDVIVSTDIYGTVLAGVVAGMVGGSYLTPVGNIGDNIGLFEPMHGPNPRFIRDGEVNPTSAILSGAMALDYLGMSTEAEKIRRAVRDVYAKGTVTRDVGGSSTIYEFTDAVIDTMISNM
ncbi:3-isopropylmalate/3-methylmalate dehydrogenase [Candidatus Methanoplasma termitum]|uniref:LeuB protein n=1 Tax=Candidatus Methanoplasma termitum TaxID=1577791 RepID=A0A0A7LD77_9ARCH|nr:isocitrate/isopropylmalate family dehydrogenase [Candidatus Methanoplasma termitum]AIZ56262.1 3-isopropylmalate/3-methylmalate dehydrogenase [Candidatus Methanoplasma termitum]MCL2333723.1 isocitrate/isopropylmalate family dehydrogenase [Candidatus Methanoplasma sp.]